MRIFLGFDFTDNFISQQNYISLDFPVLSRLLPGNFHTSFPTKRKTVTGGFDLKSCENIIRVLLIINKTGAMTILSHSTDRYYQPGLSQLTN